MTQGSLFSPDTGGRVKWINGELSWKMLFGFGGKPTDLTAKRCSDCGFVEFYADPKAKPIDTMAGLVDENEQLRKLVSKLNDRLATVEAIVVDPGTSTSAEIDRLRQRPASHE
jgi:hypothetical protein